MNRPMMIVSMLACFAVGNWAVSVAPGEEAKPDAKSLSVYIGTYTRGDSQGIYHYRLDPASGKLTPAGVTTGVVNPSFLAVHPNRRFLYAVNEISNFQGKKCGGVGAFAIDPQSGALTLLNQQPSGGIGPCHLVVDERGKNVLVANYSSGSVCVLPIGTDGRLGDRTAFVQHEGSSVNPRRQKGPHAHSINLDRDNRFAVVADLGLDKILVYRFDAEGGSLRPNVPPFASAAPGAGPRHFAFHPAGQFAYVINEMASTVTAFSYNADRGLLDTIQTVSTLPKGFDGNNSTAEVQVHPSGKFLYGSNRGHDSIAVFRIDADSGGLSYVANRSTQGKTPRNFGIDPTGRYLLAANQGTGTVVVFCIDADTGDLSPTGNVANVPMPVCVKMFTDK